MADVEPLRALHYDLARVGPLADLVSPPYDVIDSEQRAELAARSPHNVVAIDLPEHGDYAGAAATLARWIDEAAIVRDARPALWALQQEYADPDGARHTRDGYLCRVRIEEYGAGRIRPHERTHPGPREDRLRLTRATHANLSPIFSLFSDPAGRAATALEPHTTGEPWGEVTDDEGTVHRLWRIDDADAIEAVQDATADTELLIADGHHRYETARVYAEEVGGEGDHRYVLMCLVALEDPGLRVFPTHRLIRDLDRERQDALRGAIQRDFDVEELASADELVPAEDGRLRFGYLDAHHRRPLMLTLKSTDLADAALSDQPKPYRRLNTAVLEALVLKGALGMTDEGISHLDGLGYARSFQEARELVESGAYDAGFFLAGTPVQQVAEVAATGASMPPKSTFFHPKLLTGMVFNPLGEPPDG